MLLLGTQPLTSCEAGARREDSPHGFLYSSAGGGQCCESASFIPASMGLAGDRHFFRVYNSVGRRISRPRVLLSNPGCTAP